MAGKRGSDKGGDLLGLLAFGSLLGNVALGVQSSNLAEERTWWANQANLLKQAYGGLMVQYRNLVQRYEQVKRLNEQLFGEVTCLREQCDGLAKERSSLLQERTALTQERDGLRRKLKVWQLTAAKRRTENRSTT
jgi:hypothetical protein